MWLSVICFAHSPHVESVYTGENGIFNVLRSQKKTAVLIDASTIDPAVARKVTASSWLSHYLSASVCTISVLGQASKAILEDAYRCLVWLVLIC